jgi:hypothetical protein
MDPNQGNPKTKPMHPLIDRLVVLFAVVLLPGFLFSQESILSSSGTGTGDAGTVTYSVGQLFIRNNDGAGGFVTEGVQQPYEILILEGIGDGNGLQLDCSVYPNPAETWIRLSLPDNQKTGLTCRLSTLTGVPLVNMTISGEVTVVPMEDLTPGIYLLTISDKESPLKTLKVIKK